MKVMFLGHAGLFIETGGASLLCDPWFNPAFLGSWYPFPANDCIDHSRISHPDFLYISHQHQDHFDRKFLTESVSKDARVILPEFPIPLLRTELEQCGFKHFIETKNNETVSIDRLRFAVTSVVSPSDGPIGDSALAFSDGETLVFNQNDSHPRDLAHVKSLGSVDAHFTQFSGAIWYPFVYDFPAEEMARLGKIKRVNQQGRALSYIAELNAKHVFPCAGPPCFLDEELFELNDFANDPANIFVDQKAFLDFMREAGHSNGKLLVPGSTVLLNGCTGSAEPHHPISQAAINDIFQDKRRYLKAYKKRKAEVISSFRGPSHERSLDIVATIKCWFEPLLLKADHICANIDTCILIDASPNAKLVIDFHRREVRSWVNEICPYRFIIHFSLLEKCVAERSPDWVSDLFLSFRFRAERDLPFNEHVYAFFMCLTDERLAYVESYYGKAGDDGSNNSFVRNGYRIARFCPHRGADLEKFGRIDGDILTCQIHGWRFDLDTGKCLSAVGHWLSVEAVEIPCDD